MGLQIILQNNTVSISI